MKEDRTAGPAYTILEISGEVLPADPYNLTVDASDLDSISVHWEIDDYTCIDHFLLCWRDENTGLKMCVSVPDLSYTISVRIYI